MQVGSLAHRALEEILGAQYDAEPLVIVEAPPGAGKTGSVVAQAVQGALILGERVLIATPTYEQLRTIVSRIRTQYPRTPLTIWVPRDRRISASEEFGARAVITEAADIPTHPSVVIAVAAKWRWARNDVPTFDSMIVDEAYQVCAADYAQIAALAHRHTLIGDPGQIDPVITCAVERWDASPDGPHIPSPEAIAASRKAKIIKFPISRRLPQDTVGIIGDLFYPGLPFTGLDDYPARALVGSPRSPLLSQIVAGATLIGTELPSSHTGERDAAMVEHLMGIVDELLAGGFTLRLHGQEYPLREEHIGIVAPHVSQVSMLQQASRWPGVFIETANRYQGLERPIMLAWHPLSSRATPQEFHLDVGRSCVMVSRHQVACIVAWRAGIERQLHENPPTGGRTLSGRTDRIYQGWYAQMEMLRRLRASGRVVVR